jgi:hypothetical protein
MEEISGADLILMKDRLGIVTDRRRVYEGGQMP